MFYHLFSRIKNPTPLQIVIAGSIALAIAEYLLYFLFSIVFNRVLTPAIIALIVFFHAIIIYIVFYGLIDYFIYRKIKTIYKAIARSKYTKNKVDSIMNLNNDILNKVQHDVLINFENEKLEIEQLKRIEEYRKQFLSNVSHELKTPIFNIQGYIETLIDGAINDKSVNLNYLKKAANNIERITNIVKDLDMISQIEDGKLQVDLYKFNLHEIVVETMDSLAMIAQQNSVSLSVKDSLRSNCFVKADKERIRQVLTNLIANAIRYNKPKGRVQIGAYDMDEKILVEVCDTGIGIEEKYLNRIFERFFRVDKSRSRELGGTGLGLAIVKHILDAHNQSINVRSTLNEGTTFSFTLDKS